MAGRPIPEDISTRLRRIAELAREDPRRSFLNLAHYIDVRLLREAFHRTRKDGAVGVDGQTAREYEEKLEENLQSLLDRFKSGSFLDLRVRDGVLRRAIGKWLNAGVLEEEAWHQEVTGTPQGGVISPLLANIYLHEVLDKWFVNELKPRLLGRAFLIRFADDFVLVFSSEKDAKYWGLETSPSCCNQAWLVH
jgi:retron-type reverse transcriptase